MTRLHIGLILTFGTACRAEKQDKANQFRTMTKKFYAGEYDIDQLLAEGSRIISE